ncbi:MAG: hypothetical protein MJZ66_04870 [Bacteroidales bacterium]|nr:hypothetical protein [Bacteroidales bacterium]
MRKNINKIMAMGLMLAIMASACSSLTGRYSAKEYNTITDTLFDDTTGAMVLHYVNFVGMEIKMESYIHDSIDDSWFLFGCMQNIYNDRALVDSQIFFMPDIVDLKLKPLELDIWNYDESGNIIESRHCVSGGEIDKWSNISRYTYEYSGDTIYRETYYCWMPDDSTWQMQHDQHMMYDKQGRLKFTQHYEIDPDDTTKMTQWLEEL